MASWQAHLVSMLLRNTFKRRLAAAKSADQARRVMNGSTFFKVPGDVRIEPAELGQTCSGEWITSATGGGDGRDHHPILLYLHGGGYIACSAKTHRAITTFFAQHGFEVYAPEYRLAPEHPFPAGLEDAVAAYRALRSGNPGMRIFIAGDSAGGGLSLAAMLRLREAGDKLPDAAVLFSPLTDLTGKGASRVTNDKRCAMFHGKGLDMVARYYLRGTDDAADPLVSPLFAELGGLPPMLIHVGADETLLDDSTAFAERARAAGVSVELKIWPVAPHVWQLAHRWMPEGRQSLEEAAAFLKRV